MITSSVNHPAHQGLVERYECMDCGHVGPAADLRSHAAQDVCRNFRTTTTRVSSTGRLLDELVEVGQSASRSFSAETRLNQAILSFDRKVQFT
jgi:hypothetical protein